MLAASTMGETIIRDERPGDEEGIRAVLEAAFPTDDEARLVDRLRAAGLLVVSRVAERGGEIIGHVAISPVILGRRNDGVGLAPLAVHPTAQRRGIGERLVQSALERCRALELGWIVVLGEPAYYGRFGFRPAPEHGLRDEYGGGAAFQVLELRRGALAELAGLVRYSLPFADL